jgi:hypothetical protein
MPETQQFWNHQRLLMYNIKQASNREIKMMDQNKRKSGHFEIMFT